MNIRTVPAASILACLIAFGLLVTACGGDDDYDAPATATRAAAAPTTPPTAAATATPSATGTVTSTATPEATAAPPAAATEFPEELTGVPAVDAVIKAVLSGDLDGLQARVQLRSLPCGPQTGVGSPPPCPSGEPDGTPVPVFPVATCEGEWRPESAVASSLAPLVHNAPELYAVYGMPQQFQQLMPDGQYVAVFSRNAPGQGRLGAGVVIGTQRIVGVWYGCGDFAEQIVPAGTATILPPRT